MFRQTSILVFMIGAVHLMTACGPKDGDQSVTAQIVCGAVGANSVMVIIRDAVPGDAVKGSVECDGIEVATCTATVPAGGNSADCSAASTADGSGLALSCPAAVVGGNPTAAQYTVSC